MGYPVGPLLQTLAERVLTNLRYIEAQAPRADADDFDRPPYADTQLLISLLGVLVFPHERTPGALGELVRGYRDIDKIVRVHYSSVGNGRAEIADDSGNETMVDASSVKNLPRLLRNSIAHFNILPLDRDGRFDGIRVWNTNDDGLITFVADIRFDDLRSFSEHMLESLANSERHLQLDDPVDPLELVGKQQAPPRERRAPRVVDQVWRRFLAAHNDDAVAAQTAISRVLGKEAANLAK